MPTLQPKPSAWRTMRNCLVRRRCEDIEHGRGAWPGQVWTLAFAVAVGVLAGLGGVGFRYLVELFQLLFWGGAGRGFAAAVDAAPFWLVLFAPAVGGLLAGPIITFLAPEAKGPGVPEVIYAVVARHSTIPHKVPVLKTLVTSLLIGSGASVGREGPLVQIGAAVGSSLAQLFGLPPALRRSCLAAGAAAGIAGAFNAPIAGAMFAMEVILLDVEVSYLSHIVIAAVTATVTARAFLGDLPAITAGVFVPGDIWELAFYPTLGILAGLAALGFGRLIWAMASLFERAPLPEWLRPALGGLLLGAMALVFPRVLGVGYETVLEALDASLPLKAALIMLAAKTLATALCIGSGMSGGIFAPSLVLGACLGTALPLLAAPHLAAMGLHAPPAASLALAGMGAVVAGTTLAPITAVMTIVEVTRSYAAVAPLLLACIASVLTVRVLGGRSVYELKLLRRGVDIVRGHDVSILRMLRVRDFMQRDFTSFQTSTPFDTVAETAAIAPYPHFVVLDEHGNLAGVLSLRDLRKHIGRQPDERATLIAADLMTPNPARLPTTANLDEAMRLFSSRHVSFLPVMDEWIPGRVAGILKSGDVLEAYAERVLKDRVLSPRD